jgi:16S rRNA (cytidine1402-2'-O)-methyltransferase
VSEEETSGLSRKDAVREVARRAGLPKRTVYDAVHREGERT